MSTPIAPNDALREIMPRLETSRAESHDSRTGRNSGFETLLNQALEPALNYSSPSSDQGNHADPARTSETIGAIDRTGPSEFLRDEEGLNACAGDSSVADHQDGSVPPPATPLAQIIPPPQSSAIEFAMLPEFLFFGGAPAGAPTNAVPADLPAQVPPVISPGAAIAGSAVSAPMAPNGDLVSDSQPTSTSPAARTAAQTPASSSFPTPEPLIAFALVNVAPKLSSTPQALDASHPAPGVPGVASTAMNMTSTGRIAATGAAPSPISNAPPEAAPASAGHSSTLPVNVPASVTTPEAPAVFTPTAPDMLEAPDIVALAHANSPRATDQRTSPHPAATFTAQLAQQPVDRLETPLVPAQGVADRQFQPASPEASNGGNDVHGPDALASGSPVAATAMSDVNAARINAAAAPDQILTRALRAAAHPAIAQVAIIVTKAALEGVDRITIKLQPPELGRIDVRLDVGVDGRIQAVFAAERSATVDILQRDVRELERALQSAGLSADPGSLSFGLKQQNGQGMPRFGAAVAENEIPAPDRGAVVAALTAAAARAASDGHLDIHV